ncbi:MAG: FAD-binding protein [Lachnospiraceae bacterium]|nr:FAD-binding protein [Lachnospiraceae bacterium]
METALAIIGGGPAGLAAALAAREAGVEDILILERDSVLGGILNQCIHNGFGLHTFKEELTGPEYAYRFIRRVEEAGIPCLTDTMVVDLEEEEGEKYITAMNRKDGILTIRTKAIILAMGCRERPRGALNIPGFRPAGVYSAGTAQRLVNIEGKMPGRDVVILGSGDIGLIMARRMTLEGAKVHTVAEIMPYSGGLKRNIVQCLDDFGIPLKLSTTVVKIHGKERVEGVTLAKVDERMKPIPGTEEYIPCDTLLLSVGLLPENELTEELGAKMSPVTRGPLVNESMETSLSGVFACGNVLHVHDLVDFVSQEAALAGKAAAEWLKENGNNVTEADLVLEQVEKTASAAADQKHPERTTESSKTEAKESHASHTAAQEQQKHAGMTDVGPEYQEDSAAGKEDMREEKRTAITVEPGAHVRYTVPSKIRPDKAGEETLIRFRVDNVLQDHYLCVSYDGEVVSRKKKRILAPGEMEQVVIRHSDFEKHPELSRITVHIEAE